MDLETSTSATVKNRLTTQERSRLYYLANSERIKAYQREYNKANAAKVAARRSAYGKVYRANNRDKINARVNAYRAAHPEITHAKFRAYWDKNKAHIREVKRRWRKARPDAVKATRKKIHRRRWNTQPEYRILFSLRNRLRTALGENPKTAPTMRLAGTTPRKLKAHLESLFLPGMTWANYGRKGWHIDHIVPCAAFDLSDPAQQRRCFHWSNLRPLWAKANIKKGASTDGQFNLPLSPIAMEA